MECSLLSNCLPKINQIWTYLSWAHQHQCHSSSELEEEPEESELDDESLLGADT